jgi:hypothetical protein
MALLAEGEAYFVAFYKYGPPGGGRSLARRRFINMAFVVEGENYHVAFYKYGPSDGGGTEAVSFKAHF